MSSSDDETSSSWESLSQRPEWQDVQPIPQPDSLAPVVTIKYTTQAKEILSYFRAVRAAKELSPRALYLTQEVIYINSADYTAWAYRWQCLEALENLDSEMLFINKMASRSPKNYQLWNHRRRFAFKRGASHAQEELKYAAQCLAQDAKNYHAWAHRQAIVRHFGLWEQELDAVHELLHEDVRNNSAWNQRYFIISEAPDKSLWSLETEMSFVEEKIALCPHNESSWNFLRGLLSLPDARQTEIVLSRLATFCLKVLQTVPSCPPAMTMVADIYMSCGNGKKQNSLIKQSRHILQELKVADPLRLSYWQAQLHQLPG